MQIQIIEPKKRKNQRIRVCAYCRVSTNEEEQANSLENQMTHYEDLIKNNPSYEFVGIYHDYAISGFKEKRPGFQKMLKAARRKELDLVITKSVSRFCRNTDTLLKTVRELKDLGIGILFELQSINTLEESGELLLTVLAAFAQAESDNYSTLAKMAYIRKYEAGEPIHYLERSFGYTTNRNGTFIPDPDEAPWVKRIYEMYADGYNLPQIRNYLNEHEVRTKKGARFIDSTVQQILENEIYKGDYIMHKHFVNAERKEVKNRGEVDAWYIKDDHVPIVSRKLWAAVQKKMQERRDYLATGSVVGDLNEETYPYMNHIFCAECGHPLYRRVYSHGNRANWGCSGQQRYLKEFCKGINVPDSVIRNWGDFSGNIYIRKESDPLGKAEFKYVKESTWRKNHRRKEPKKQAADLTIENYPYKDHIFCGVCGSKLTRHIRPANGSVVWICSGRKRKGNNYCSGIRIPDVVIRGWGNISEDIYISRKDDKNGKRGYSYSRDKDQARKDP